MPSEPGSGPAALPAAGASVPRPKPRAKKSQWWGLRMPVPPGTGRLLSLSSLAVVGGAWCVASYVTVTRKGELTPLVSHYFLPSPDEVLKSLFYLMFDQGLLHAVWVSSVRIIYAIGLSVLVAVPLGIAMASFDVVNRVFEPIVAPMRYLPISAFVPLMILWFDIGEKQKVAFLFLGTVVYLLPAVVDALRLVPEELVQTAFTLGATKAQVIRTVLIPAALPQIFDGIRVLNAIAWTYIILAEMVNPQSGVGYILRLADQHFKPEWSFAGILVVGVIGLVTDWAIGAVNRLLFSWREADV